MRRTSRQIIADLLEIHDPRVRDAFIDAVRDLSDSIPIGRLTDAIARGDIDGAVELINLDETVFEGISEAVRSAYVDGGRDTGQIINGLRRADGTQTVFRFSARNLAAETFLRAASSQLITQITAAQRQTVRQRLTEGLERGDNPRRTALDIAGRIDRETSNRREGGILGLTSQQSGYVENARRQLSSGDRAQLRAYLTRVQRDRRFDPTIIRAINEGRPLTQAQIDRILGRYSDRLLRLRAETISRTETLRSLNASQYEAYRQAIERGEVDADAITKRWVSAGDIRVRLTHVDLNGDVLPFNGVYITSRGNSLRFPLDVELGAGGEDVINCRCGVDYRINFARGLT